MTATRDLIRMLVTDSKDLSKWKAGDILNGRGFPFEVIHRATGIEVWVSNSWFGVSLKMPSGAKYPDDAVSLFSTLFGWATWRLPLSRLGPKFAVKKPNNFECDAAAIFATTNQGE